MRISDWSSDVCSSDLSTLINQLVGAKVSIVTHKAQTTRSRIRGIVMEGAAQIIMVDTPGIFRPTRRLDRAMVRATWAGAGDADVLVLVADAPRGLREDDPLTTADRPQANAPRTAVALHTVEGLKNES